MIIKNKIEYDNIKDRLIVLYKLIIEDIDNKKLIDEYYILSEAVDEYEFKLINFDNKNK